MISLKQGVIIDHRTDGRLFYVMYIVDGILSLNYGVKDTVVTAGLDGAHMKKSKHYIGKALDFRCSNWPDGKHETITDRIRMALGDKYDVLLEGLGTPNQHLHIEIR